MDERILKWLFDVKMAIEEIDDFFKNEEKDFFTYRQNLMLKRAVERNLEIVGEAINRILKRDASFKKNHKCKSYNWFENQVIHAYDNISDENIWSILTNHLPKLKIQIDALTEE